MEKGFIKKKVSKKLQNFIDSIANIGVYTLPDDKGMVYYSKIDGSYLSRVGMENELSFLLKKGITEQIQGIEGYEPNACCIGFNPIKQKWYGWSHRAIYGFGIGSKCKQGDVGFEESNKEEFIKTQLSFWGDTDYADGEPKAIDKSDGVLITYVYNNNVPKKLRGTTVEHFCEYPDKWGRGEWTAMTLDEAKEMAMNFAESIA